MAVAISQTADPAGAGSGTTITYTAQSIGVAEASRIVVVCVGTELTSGQPSSCTIGGVTANATALASFGAMGARVFWLPVATGTTADIAVTFGASQGATTQHICVYRVVGASIESSGTNTSTDMDSSSPLTTTSTTIKASGGFIGIAACATDTVAKTWANATKDLDEDAGTFRFTTATRAAALTATAITCTGSTNNEDGALAWIVLRPGVTAEVGAYSMTGTAAVPHKGYTVVAGASSYAITGTDANVHKGLTLVAGASSYALVGTDAVLKQARKVVPDAGAYLISGVDAATKHGWKVVGGSDSYSIAGVDPALKHGWKVAADADSYAITGTDVTLTKSGGGPSVATLSGMLMVT